MSDVVAAQLVSFDLDTHERAVLSFSINGKLIRLGFTYDQTGIIRTDSSRVYHAMTAVREKLAREAAQASAKPESDTSMQPPE